MSDIVYGRNPVLETLKSGRQVRSILVSETSKKGFDDIIELAVKAGTPVKTVSISELDKLSPDSSHQGIIAKTAPFEFKDIAFLLKRVEGKDRSIVLLLDGITDPQNLGSIIRSAEIFGADGIVIPKARTAAVSSATWRASSGAIEHIPIIRSNLTDAANRLKGSGFWLIGSSVSADQTIRDFDWPDKTAIVLGSEGSGLSKRIKDGCDFLVSVPMMGKIPSLNVSVTGGILLYDYNRYLERVNNDKK